MYNFFLRKTCNTMLIQVQIFVKLFLNFVVRNICYVLVVIVVVKKKVG